MTMQRGEARTLAHDDDGVERREPLAQRLHAGDRETAQERLAITCLMFVYSSTAYIDRSLP